VRDNLPVTTQIIGVIRGTLVKIQTAKISAAVHRVNLIA